MSGIRQNLEQVRARNADKAIKGGLQGRGVSDGDAISGFPALVVNNGLLATLGFSISKKNNGGYKEICDAIAEHLGDDAIGLLPKDRLRTLTGLRDHLVASNSVELRRCTAEALAYLNYLRRFAKGESKRREDDNLS